jgi:predicted alpha/beta superfamily hydrolase
MLWRRETHSLGEGLVAEVALPEGYDDRDADYPLLVCLDPQWTFGTVCDSALNLGLARLIPRVIVAGIGWDTSSSREVLRLRGEAYTPTDAPFPDRVAPRDAGPAPSGGAPRYQRWLLDEALPFLDDRYRSRPGQRLVVGHSLSALFGLYCLCTAPGAFSHYLLASPSIWWDDRVILEIEAREAARPGATHGKVFISVGADEEVGGLSPMVSNAKEVAERLGSRGHPELDLTLALLPGEIHFSTIPAAVSRGLRWLLDS